MRPKSAFTSQHLETDDISESQQFSLLVDISLLGTIKDNFKNFTLFTYS